MKIVIHLSLFLLIFWSVSCHNQTPSHQDDIEYSENFHGDLYFKVILLENFYGFPDSLIQTIHYKVDSLTLVDSLSEDNLVFIEKYNLLRKNNLLTKPYFHLKIDSALIATVYVQEADYEKIEWYKRRELINSNKKVRVELTGKRIAEDIIDCREIIYTEVIDGKTYWRKYNAR